MATYTTKQQKAVLDCLSERADSPVSAAAIVDALREQGELSVRNAILNSAKQCSAIEGAYPSSLAYLEENYGLVVNRSDYAITYEVFADNVMPNVVVLAK